MPNRPFRRIGARVPRRLCPVALRPPGRPCPRTFAPRRRRRRPATPPPRRRTRLRRPRRFRRRVARDAALCAISVRVSVREFGSCWRTGARQPKSTARRELTSMSLSFGPQHEFKKLVGELRPVAKSGSAPVPSSSAMDWAISSRKRSPGDERNPFAPPLQPHAPLISPAQ
jgi:hypothetical protein